MTAIRSMAVLVLFGLLLGVSSLAAASPQGETSFDGWSLSGRALDGRGQSEAVRKASTPCAEVHSLIEAYNTSEPWISETPRRGTWLDGYFDDRGDTSYATRITPINLSGYQIDSVQVWAGVDMFEAFETCTTIHNTGWLPAGSGILAIVGTDDPGCDYGELAFVRAHFLYRPDWGWSFAPGTNLTDDFDGFELADSNPLEVVCGRIFPEDVDVAGFSESVPSVQVNHNPMLSGLAGLETWLWYDFDRADSPSSLVGTASIVSRGASWTLEAEAWIDLISWDVDCVTQCDYRGMASAFDGSSLDGLAVDFEDSVLGPADNYDGGTGIAGGFAAGHVYQERGVYTISTRESWRGRYTWSGVSYPYADVIVAGSQPFTVGEARGVLTAPAR